MYRLITVDLDGTLLSSKNIVTEYTKKIIRLLFKKRFYFILASGRHFIDLMDVKKYLKIQAFIISSNGAKIYDLNNKLIFSNDINKDIALKICKIEYFSSDITTQIYRKNQWYINNNKIDNNFFPNLSLLQYKYFDLDYLKINNISKIFFTSKNFKKLYILKKKIISDFKNQVNVNFSSPGCLEVISGQSSKGNGLKLVSDMLKISLEECITFGDGMNDEDMLRISGKACIMKNGDPNLKKKLPNAEIIGSNNNNGVAVFLDKMFLRFKR